MSYEHCDIHDEPATNGCFSCRREIANSAKRQLYAIAEIPGAPLPEAALAYARAVELSELGPPFSDVITSIDEVNR